MKAMVANQAESVTGFLAFWQTYGPVLTGGAVIISATIAFGVLLSNRSIARRRATLDLILHIESDGDLIKARKEFIKIKKSAVRSSEWGKEDKRDSEEANHIKTILNINELVAVSIKEGVISENVFRTWFNGAFIDDYKQMTGYIQETRDWKKSDKIFQELESVAKRWQDTNDQWYAKPTWIKRKFYAFRLAIYA